MSENNSSSHLYTIFSNNVRDMLSTNRLIVETNAAAMRYNYSLFQQAIRENPQRFVSPMSPRRTPRPRTSPNVTLNFNTREQSSTQDNEEQPRTRRRLFTPSEQEQEQERERNGVNSFIHDFIHFIENDAIQNITRLASQDSVGTLNNIAIIGENSNQNSNGMTSSQIRESTTSGTYSEFATTTNSATENDDDNDADNDAENDAENTTTPPSRCPISWVPFEDNTPVLKINGCGHIFSQRSLTEWLSLHSTCPTCRFDLIQSNEQHRQQNPNNIPQGVETTSPETPDPVGVDLNNSAQSSFGIFTNLLQGSPVNNGQEILDNIRENISRNVVNANFQ